MASRTGAGAVRGVEGASKEFSNRAKGQIIEVGSGHRVKPGSVDGGTDREPLQPWI